MDCRSRGKKNVEERNTRFDRKKCYYCKEIGHIKGQYPKWKADKARERASVSIEEEGDISLIAIERSDNEDQEKQTGMALTVIDELQDIVLRAVQQRKDFSDLFIADTGASGHMSGRLDGMSNLRDCDDDVIIGNGKAIKAVKIGDKRGYVTDSEGARKRVVFKNTKYIPELGPYSLCSVTHSLDQGFDLSNEERMIVLKKGKFKIEFNEEIKTKNGYVCGVRVDAEAEIVAPALKDK